MKFTLFVVMTVLLTAATTWAHHGSAEFDQTKPLHLSGTISKTEWADPHVLINLSVIDADRKVTEWLVECPPPIWMRRAGFPQSAFEAGTELAVEGYQAKDGSNRINAANSTTVANQDGKLTLIGVGKGIGFTRDPSVGLLNKHLEPALTDSHSTPEPLQIESLGLSEPGNNLHAVQDRRAGI